MLYFLLLWPAFSTGLVPKSGDAYWAVEQGSGNYRLSVSIRLVEEGEVSWTSRFDTGISLNEPLTFRIKSGNGTLVSVVRLTSKGGTLYYLDYEMEGVVDRGGGALHYLKSRGGPLVMLGRELVVSPFDAEQSRNRLRRMAQMAGKAESLPQQGSTSRDSSTVLIGFRVDPP